MEESQNPLMPTQQCQVESAPTHAVLHSFEKSATTPTIVSRPQQLEATLRLHRPNMDVRDLFHNVPISADQFPGVEKRRTIDSIDFEELMQQAIGGFRLFVRAFTDELLQECFQRFCGLRRYELIPLPLRNIVGIRDAWNAMLEIKRQQWIVFYEKMYNGEKIGDLLPESKFSTEERLESDFTRQQLAARRWIKGIALAPDKIPCPLCARDFPKRFSSAEKLMAHIVHSHSSVRLYACTFCAKAFICKELLLDHAANCAPYKKYLEEIQQNTEKLTFEHAYVSLVCADCGLQIKISPHCTQQEFIGELLNCMKLIDFSSVTLEFPSPAFLRASVNCSFCEVKFENLHFLELHCASEHREEAVKTCKEENCLQKFYTDDALRDHLMSHLTDAPPICQFLEVALMTAPVSSNSDPNEDLIIWVRANKQTFNDSIKAEKKPVRRRKFEIEKRQISDDCMNMLKTSKKNKTEHLDEKSQSIIKQFDSNLLFNSLHKMSSENVVKKENQTAEIMFSGKKLNKRRNGLTLRARADLKAFSKANDEPLTYSEWINEWRFQMKEISSLDDSCGSSRYIVSCQIQCVFDGRIIIFNPIQGQLLCDDVFYCRLCLKLSVGEHTARHHFEVNHSEIMKDNELYEAFCNNNYQLFSIADFPFEQIRCSICSSKHCSIAALRKHFVSSHSLLLPKPDLNEHSEISTFENCAERLMLGDWERTPFDKHLESLVEDAVGGDIEDVFPIYIPSKILKHEIGKKNVNKILSVQPSESEDCLFNQGILLKEKNICSSQENISKNTISDVVNSLSSMNSKHSERDGFTGSSEHYSRDCNDEKVLRETSAALVNSNSTSISSPNSHRSESSLGLQTVQQKKPKAKVVNYDCFLCTLTFDTVPELQQHFREHPERWPHCSLCALEKSKKEDICDGANKSEGELREEELEKFMQIAEFYKHLEKHHIRIENNRASCSFCSFTSNSKMQLRKQISMMVRHLIYECVGSGVCLLCSVDEEDLYNKLEIEDSEENEDKLRMLEEKFRQHRLQNHRLIFDRIICESCKCGFYSTESFQLHQCESAYRCRCNPSLRFMNKTSFERHALGLADYWNKHRRMCSNIGGSDREWVFNDEYQAQTAPTGNELLVVMGRGRGFQRTCPSRHRVSVTENCASKLKQSDRRSASILSKSSRKNSLSPDSNEIQAALTTTNSSSSVNLKKVVKRRRRGFPRLTYRTKRKRSNKEEPYYNVPEKKIKIEEVLLKLEPNEAFEKIEVAHEQQHPQSHIVLQRKRRPRQTPRMIGSFQRMPVRNDM